MPRSHMIKKAELTKAGRWTPGCRKCGAMKAGDLSFRNKMQRAEERKDGARRPMEPFPKEQTGGSSSFGSALVDVTTHSSPLMPRSKKGREVDLEIDQGGATKVLVVTSGGITRGRSSSNSSRSSSSSSIESSSQEEDEKIDGEDKIMHMNLPPTGHGKDNSDEPGNSRDGQQVDSFQPT